MGEEQGEIAQGKAMRTVSSSLFEAVSDSPTMSVSLLKVLTDACSSPATRHSLSFTNASTPDMTCVATGMGKGERYVWNDNICTAAKRRKVRSGRRKQEGSGT